MPAPLTITARRAMVEELMRQEPGISQRSIAARLGVGKDTIRRDVDAIEAAQRHAAPQPAAPELEPAPEGTTLVLPLNDELREALAVLRSTTVVLRGRADTPAVNAKAAHIAICTMADMIRQHHPQEGAER